MQHALITHDESAQAEIFQLPQEERHRVAEICQAIQEIAHSKRPLSAACRAVAARYSGRRGFTAKSLQRYYHRYKEQGIAGLARSYKAPSSKLPPEFIKYWNGLVAESSRQDAVAAARETLIYSHWFADRPIPGYGRITEWWPFHRAGRPLPRGVVVRPGDLPQGWSETNLRRNVVKSRAVRTVQRQGHHAAHDHLAQLLRDRSQLRPLELITFDDVRLDLQTVFTDAGKPQVAYINAVFALDVATGTILGKGLKPRYKREDDTHAGVTRAETRFLLLHILENYQLPDHRVNLLLENASAALSPQDTRDLETVFGDALQIETTGMLRRQLLTSGFKEQGGMPWQKGWIEAYFRKLHGAYAHLDGATGRRYDLDPADLGDRAAYTRQLLRQARDAGVDTGELWLPFLRFEEAHQVIDELVTRLNWRTNHDLQGFGEVHEFRLEGADWQPIQGLYRLPPDQRLAAEIHARKEAPAERFNRLLKDVKTRPIPPAALLPLYADRRAVKVRGGQVTIKGLESEPIVYRESGHPALEEDGTQYTAAVSTDRAQLHLFTDRLAYVASIPRWSRVPILDKEAIQKAAGAVHRDRQIDYAHAADNLSARNARYEEGRANNAALLEAAKSGTQMQKAETSIPWEKKQTTGQAEATRRRHAQEAALARQLAEEDDD